MFNQTASNGDTSDDEGSEGNCALWGNEDYEDHDCVWKVLMAIMLMILNTDCIPG